MVSFFFSLFQTLISLFNLSQDKFYYNDEIVNVFLEKMHGTIGSKVKKHVDNVRRHILGHSNPVPRLILEHILADKFGKSIDEGIRESAGGLSTPTVSHLVLLLQALFFVFDLFVLKGKSVHQLYIQEVVHQRITLQVTQITVILTLRKQVEIWYVAFYAYNLIPNEILAHLDE